MNKKIIGSVIGFIVIIIALVSMNMVQKNSEETEKQKKKEANNIASAAAFYIATETMGMISEDVLSGYSTTWSNAINNRKDFNLAIAEKKKSRSEKKQIVYLIKYRFEPYFSITNIT